MIRTSPVVNTTLQKKYGKKKRSKENIVVPHEDPLLIIAGGCFICFYEYPGLRGVLDALGLPCLILQMYSYTTTSTTTT